MHKTSLSALLALLIITIPYFSFAFPFGGAVTAIEPCDEGMLLWVAVPVVGGGVVEETFLWLQGELPYAMFVPPHVGQFLLGDARLTPAICTDGPSVLGEGFPIFFHGESL